jgi:hypothetical protein
MPNRVEGTAPGVQPAAARPEAARTGQRAGQPADTAAANADQMDRVEISQAAQTRNQELQAANAPGANTRGAAANAPGAQAPEAGAQGGNLEQTAQRNAEQVREQQQAAQQQTQRGPQRDAGNIVDITG